MNNTPNYCEATCDVENVPDYALCYRYWIVTPSRGRLWFWGAWKRRSEAEKNCTDDRFVVEFEYAIENRRRQKEREKENER